MYGSARGRTVFGSKGKWRINKKQRFLSSMGTKAAGKAVRPLVKWAGGKFEEFSEFAPYIPAFDRYFEPFFGGGGVFFALLPIKGSAINDKSKDLTTFYKSLGRPSFKKEIFDLVDSWEALNLFHRPFCTYVMDRFRDFLAGDLDQARLFAYIDEYFLSVDVDTFADIYSFLAIDKKVLPIYLCKSVKDKFKRIKHLEARKKERFTEDRLKDHVETAIRSGFYCYMRYLMNEGENTHLTADAYTTVWYFVREFCYASMFRFNAQGKFNIPYGGIAYNKKNLRTKANALFSDEVKCVFEHCRIFNMDFEGFLDIVKPSTKDFIFLDPPYDSEFSEYDQHAFTRQDQVRLRDCLHRQSAKWMLVIKETSFIRDLYEEINANFIDFDKTYLYNVRGRNNRRAKHLIITNYTMQ